MRRRRSLFIPVYCPVVNKANPRPSRWPAPVLAKRKQSAVGIHLVPNGNKMSLQ